MSWPAALVLSWIFFALNHGLRHLFRIGDVTPNLVYALVVAIGLAYAPIRRNLGSPPARPDDRPPRPDAHQSRRSRHRHRSPRPGGPRLHAVHPRDATAHEQEEPALLRVPRPHGLNHQRRDRRPRLHLPHNSQRPHRLARKARTTRHAGDAVSTGIAAIFLSLALIPLSGFLGMAQGGQQRRFGNLRVTRTSRFTTAIPQTPAAATPHPRPSSAHPSPPPHCTPPAPRSGTPESPSTPTPCSAATATRATTATPRDSCPPPAPARPAPNLSAAFASCAAYHAASPR